MRLTVPLAQSDLSCSSATSISGCQPVTAEPCTVFQRWPVCEQVPALLRGSLLNSKRVLHQASSMSTCLCTLLLDVGAAQTRVTRVSARQPVVTFAVSKVKGRCYGWLW